MKQLESFDIFDTVLTRAAGSPTALFILLGKTLRDQSLIGISPQAFARLRVEAEAQSRQKHGWREVTLDMIYHELCGTLPLSETQRQRAMQCECETEEMLLRAIPDTAGQLAAARQRNGRAIFISDMYLPGPLVQRWLAQHNLWQEGDRLYLSNEAGDSKASGGLFRRVLQQEGLTPEGLIHTGNDVHSDVALPARLGIGLRPFLEGNLNRYESIMETQAAATGGLSSLWAGASRLARLSVSVEGASQKILRDVSAAVMAPTLAAYLVWVLRRARDLSLRRLYFVSRDGQVLLETARHLAPKLGVNCELRYLYASRQSWHLPAITRIDESKLEWICMKYDFLSIRSLLFRVGLRPEDVGDELCKAGFDEEGWCRDLQADEIERVKRLLLCGSLQDLILSQAAVKRKALLGYLGQEGLLEDEPWALVDVGWNGRLQASLGDVLATAGGPAPRGFYFALAGRPMTCNAGTFEAYLFEPSRPEYGALLSKVDLSTFLEIACSANHGTVDDFQRLDGRYVPVLRSERNQAAIAWGLPILQETIGQFAKHLVLDDLLVDASADLRPALATLLRAFWEHPTREEAAVWGRFPFENDQSGATSNQIAQPYATAAVFRALVGRGMGKPCVSFWQAGSIMISPAPARIALQTGMRLKRFLRKSFASVRN